MGYEDNPDEVIEYLKRLTKPELKLYLNGYKQACLHIREALTKGKLELLTILFTSSGNEADIIAHSIDLLDIYEATVRKREDSIITLYLNST